MKVDLNHGELAAIRNALNVMRTVDPKITGLTTWEMTALDKIEAASQPSK